MRALDQLKESKGTVAANRTQAYARAAYSWAAKRQLVGANPLRGIERPGRESARERVLTAEELASIRRACDGLGTTRGAFVRTLMLTLQRREEVVSMRWTELDNPTDPTIWTLPGERAKNGKAHVVHLAEPVRAILRALPKMENNPFVFAGRSVVGPIAAFSATKLAIENAIKETSGRSIADWRFHDFRRAGVTALAGMGFPPHVCDRLLNHITGAIQGVTAVYQRGRVPCRAQSSVGGMGEVRARRRRRERLKGQRRADEARRWLRSLQIRRSLEQRLAGAAPPSWPDVSFIEEASAMTTNCDDPKTKSKRPGKTQGNRNRSAHFPEYKVTLIVHFVIAHPVRMGTGWQSGSGIFLSVSWIASRAPTVRRRAVSMTDLMSA